MTKSNKEALSLFLTIPIVLLLNGFLVQLAWNNIIVDLTGFKEIGYWAAFFLNWILFQRKINNE